VDYGLIEDTKGGIVPVSSFGAAAFGACLDQNRHAAHPFLCFDLTYIYALLRHGFGLNEDTELVLKRKIKGKESSWGLGAAFVLLTGS